MTDVEWSSEPDPRKLLQFLRGATGPPDTRDDPQTSCVYLPLERYNPRTMRLYAVACCRALPINVFDERSTAILTAAERFADARTNSDRSGIRAARRSLNELGRESAVYRDGWHCGYSNPSVSLLAETCRRDVLRGLIPLTDRRLALWNRSPHPGGGARCYAELLRDIVGSPFRPVSVEPRWLTSSVLALARAMYESRDFAAMPILGDALEEAGCDSPEILAHCRGGPHTRGCWAVDLVFATEQHQARTGCLAPTLGASTPAARRGRGSRRRGWPRHGRRLYSVPAFSLSTRRCGGAPTTT
jgi:hypothetical protein